jgi:hypothetical protein
VVNTLVACPNCNGEDFSFIELNNANVYESWDIQEGNISENSFNSDAEIKTGFFGRSTESILERDLKRELAQKKTEFQNFLKSPTGRATTAKENGNGFFEIELEVGSSDRQVFFGTADFGRHTKKDFTGLLSAIEKVGWHLEHVGYYFMITGESSRDKFLASGQSVAVSGKTMGVYLFRNMDKENG